MMKFIFLSYINRSGSTFLANHLSKSTEICVCPESDALFDVFLNNSERSSRRLHSKKILEYIYNEEKFIHWNISPEELREIVENSEKSYQAFLRVMTVYARKNKANAKYVLFKHNNLLAANIIRSLSTHDVFYLSILRSPFEIYESQNRSLSPYTKKVMCDNPVTLANQWNRYVSQITRINGTTHFRLIRFDELMTNTNKLLEELSRDLRIEQFTLEGEGDIAHFLSEPYKVLHTKATLCPLPSDDLWKRELSGRAIYAISTICRQNLLRYGMPVVPVNGKGMGVAVFVWQLKYVFGRMVYLLRRVKRRVIW